MRNRFVSSSMRSGAAAVGALTLLALLLRVPGLRDLPIFGDEAIFLRLARLLQEEPIRNFWISLQEASAPLHTWILALTLSVTSDPVRAGRVLSVVAGVLTVPAAAWASARVAAGFGAKRPEVAAVAAAALSAVCPFFVLSQRIARVDALFLFEAAIVSGVSVTMAERARSDRSRAVEGVGFGLLMGMAMLTRQAVSYPLWILPFVALIALGGRGGEAMTAPLTRLTRPMLVAAGVAAALWAPMLLAPAWPDLATRIFHLAATRPAVAAPARAELFAGNLRIAAVSLWVYLTPPVCIAAALGVLLLAASRRWRLLGFLAALGAILLAPAVLFAASYFPRYALPAALPLIATAAAAAELVWRPRNRAPRAARAAAGALGLAILAWPLLDVRRGLRDWARWRLLPVDRAQLVSGWSAGFASESAARFLEGEARLHPIAVVVPEVSGNPSDGVWLLLEGAPNVRLFYTAGDALEMPWLLPRGPRNAYRLRGDLRASGRLESVTFAPGEPIYAVAPDPFLTRQGWKPALALLAARNPGLSEVARFENPGGDVAVVVLRLR